jgi:hypothetical protein
MTGLDAWLRWIHLGAFTVWSATALGAYWLVVVARRESRRAPEDGELARRDEWVRERFLDVVWLEHVAIVVLLATGVWRAYRFGLLWSWETLLEARWLCWKLALVGFVVVPFEAYDIWLSHWHLPRLLRREPPGSSARAAAWRHHDRFMWIGGGILALVIPVIAWLSVFRPL